MFKLLLVDHDQDVIIASNESCIACYNLMHNFSILRTYNISETLARDIVNISRQKPISFKCKRFCIPTDQIEPGSVDHFIKISRETTRYADLHWVICRQVQRRRNKRWMSIHGDDLLLLPNWYYEYFDKYIDSSDLIKNKFAVNFVEENKPNNNRKTMYT